MTPTLLALSLALADPNGFPAPHALAVAPAAATAPATEARAPAAPAAAAAPPAPLTLPAAGVEGGLILPVAALLALAVAALLATRRRQQAPRLVRVLETTGIGPKRALVVAQIGDEVMVIGSSEAGLQLLAARPAGLEPRAAAAPARLQAVPDPAPAGVPVLGAVRGLLSRLRGGRPAEPAPAAAAAPAFDALLAESTEDLELRRKLALGQPGSVR